MKITFTHEQIKMFEQPCRYVYFESGVPIYVGSSGHRENQTRRGMYRVFHIDDRMPERIEATRRADKLEIEFYSSNEEAVQAESNLIHEWHPRFNNMCSICGASTHPKARVAYAVKMGEEPMHAAKAYVRTHLGLPSDYPVEIASDSFTVGTGDQKRIYNLNLTPRIP
jgi:hypothetical protein